MTILAEVAQQLGEGRVRAICMRPTDGLTRGTVVRDTGRASPSRSAPRCSATSGTCGATRSTWMPRVRPTSSPTSSVGRSTATRRRSTPSSPRRDVRDRDQGDRLAHSLRRRRQDRPVRRCRRRQDGADHRDDQPRRRTARRRVGVRRGRRAHPRRHRPAAGDDRVGRVREGRARCSVRWTSHRASACASPVGADHGGVLPRRAEPGRAAVRRQHLPLRPGRLGGVDAARSDALGRRLPAHARRRDGPAAGADHVDQRPLDHVVAGRLRAR